MKLRSFSSARSLVTGLVAASALTVGAIAAIPVGAQENVLLPFEDVQFFPAAEGSPVEIAVLWGDPVNGPAGVYLRLPPGFPGAMHYHSQDYYGVVVSGLHAHWIDGEERGEGLGPGTYYFQPGGQIHADANPGDEPTVIFIFLPEGLDTVFVE